MPSSKTRKQPSWGKGSRGKSAYQSLLIHEQQAREAGRGPEAEKAILWGCSLPGRGRCTETPGRALVTQGTSGTKETGSDEGLKPSLGDQESNRQRERRAEQVRAEAACHQIMFLPVVPPKRAERELGLEACNAAEWGGGRGGHGGPRESSASVVEARAPLAITPLHNEDLFSFGRSLGGFPNGLKLLPENKNLTSFQEKESTFFWSPSIGGSWAQIHSTFFPFCSLTPPNPTKSFSPFPRQAGVMPGPG